MSIIKPITSADDFDDLDFSHFEESPSWLVDDIAAMMDSKKSRYRAPVVGDNDPSAKLAKDIRALKSKLQPDKNESYSNLRRERAATTLASDLNDARLQKTKLDSENHLDESAMQLFLTAALQQGRDKSRRHEEFMRRALYRPNPATLPSLPRRWSPTRPRTQQSKLEATAPFASTTIRPLSPPKAQRPASPGAIDFRALILQEQRAGRKVEVASKLQLEVQSRLLVLLKAASYYKLLAGRVREYRLLKLKLVRASYKIQCTFRAMRSRSSLKMYLLVPPLFTRFLHRYKRRRAVAVVQSFIRDVQSCRTKRIVRRFLMAVKKVQTYVRQYLQVREARILALSRYWEAAEREVRRNIEEQERANYARNEKLRARRMGKNTHSSSIFEKWSLTHHQVEQLYDHINDVDVTRANVIRLNEGGGKARRAVGRAGDSEDDHRNLFMEMCDPAVVRELIEKLIRRKRRLHLQALRQAEERDSGGAALHTLGAGPGQEEGPDSAREGEGEEGEEGAEQSHGLLSSRRAEQRGNNHITLKVVRRVMQDFSLHNAKDLLARQLAHAGIDVEEEERAHAARMMVAEASSKYRAQKTTMRLENFGRPEVAKEGRMFLLKTFFLLTGDLGPSWAQYVEDNVRAEILRKKKVQQRESALLLSESQRTQQERANLQRQLAYNNKHSNNPFAAGGSLESLSVTLSGGSGERHDDDDDDDEEEEEALGGMGMESRPGTSGGAVAGRRAAGRAAGLRGSDPLASQSAPQLAGVGVNVSGARRPGSSEGGARLIGIQQRNNNNNNNNNNNKHHQVVNMT